MTKKVFSFLLLLTFGHTMIAQDGVGINNDNPDASAILDVASTSQGVLVPRMTSGERDLIASPANGLLIYNTTTNTFWFFSASWTEIISSVSSDEIVDADGDTKVEVEQTADDDIIHFTSRGVEYFQMTEGRLNVLSTGNSVFMGNLAGRVDNLTNNKNVFIGNSSGQFNTTGQNNVALGYRSLRANTEGESNIAIGEDAFRRNTTGDYTISIGSNSLQLAVTTDSNIAIGQNAMSNFTSGTNNIGIGLNAMQSKTSGSNNVAVGVQALDRNLTGSRNTAIGRQAGRNSTGSGNVFVGNQSGLNELGDDKLYIDNSSTTTPLIWGDFSTDSLVVNGNLSVTNNITYVGTLTNVSDKRLKENFDTLRQVMHLVNQLQAYSYNMKSNPYNEREYGLIAQEVQKVFPEMVKVIDKEKGYIGVNYLQLVAVLIEGLKEQQQLITNLEQSQSISEERLNRLKAEVVAIQSDLNLK